MAHDTQTKDSIPLTSEEIRAIINLLKHPKIKAFAKEVEESEKKSN